jgi:biotin-(acetyl-CoA carboxylase) ligase
VNRDAFAGLYFNAVEHWHAVHAEEGGAALVAAWRDLDVVTGRRVQVRSGTDDLEGRALGVSEHGYLQVEDGRGRVHRVLAGDLRIVE